jgi:hypothetical protein
MQVSAQFSYNYKQYMKIYSHKMYAQSDLAFFCLHSVEVDLLLVVSQKINFVSIFIHTVWSTVLKTHF